jgi:dynein heavy chain
MRVFSDRLISESEVSRCRDMIVNVGKRFFEEDAEQVYADPCIFTHFVSPLTGSGPNAQAMASDDLTIYRACEDFTKVKRVLEMKLGEYNESRAMMNLVLFEQVNIYLVALGRTLSLPTL